MIPIDWQPDFPHWRSDDGRVLLINADCLEVLPKMEAGSVDLLLTDPPYSSGGQFRGDRTQTPSTKYVNTDSGETCRIEFGGDTRDQRSFLTWCTMWLGHAYSAAKAGAVALVFTDWRQLPTMTDAVQCGGWVWRNIVTWWKPGVRMQRGRFSASAEYIVYASKGAPPAGEDSPQNVLVCQPVPGDEKLHIAEKPVALIDRLIGITVPDALVCDPFAGSGVVGIAAAKRGYRFIGIEADPHYFAVAKQRIITALGQTLPLADADAPLFAGGGKP